MLTQRILTFFIVFSIFINYESLLAMNVTQQRPWEPIDVAGANVIDIDNPNGHWRTGDPDRGWIDSKFNIWGHVRSKYEYRAPHLQNGRMVFIVIHGSLPAPEAGPFNPSYYKPDDRKDQNFRHIMRFAASLAQAAGKELDLLSFQWSGLIDENARKVASMLLTQYIEAHYAQETAIVMLSHSHGCNIANLVSHQLSWPISLLIHFANPVRSNNAPMPDGNWVENLKFIIPANQLANQLFGQYNLQQIVQIGQQETQFSNQQSQAYRARYNRDINNVPRDQHQLLSAIESKCSVM